MSKPVQVDLVDWTQIEVKLNAQDNAIFDRIMEEIKRLRLDRDAALKFQLEQAENERIGQEQQQSAANRQNATA